MAKDSVTDKDPLSERETAGIDQVRDLLFGEKLNDFDRRLQRLELKIDHDDDEIETRLNKLESSLSQRLLQIEKSLATSDQTQIENIEALQNEFRREIDSLRRKLNKFEQQSLFEKIFGTDS